MATATQSGTDSTLIVRILKAPFKALWFLIRHPFLCVLIVLLSAASTISTLAHFNPAIAAHFSNAVSYFGLATLTSEASDNWRRVYNAEVRKNQTLARRLTSTEQELVKSKAETDRVKNRNIYLERDVTEKEKSLSKNSKKIAELNASIDKKNAALGKSEKALRGGAKVLRATNKELRATKSSLNSINSRLTRFRRSGRNIESKVPQRFTKVALSDGAGSVIGWVPIVGDAVSISLAAAGIYEMCQMFKEIEEATSELGVPYQIYTNTFCDAPVKKSAEIISEATDSAMDTINKRLYYTKIYWQNKAEAVL